MGSSKTGKLIKNKAPDAKKEYTLSNYKGKILVIDLFQWLYKFKIAMTKQNKEHINDMLICLWIKVNIMLQNRILPIFVSDGKPPELKQHILEKRKKQKEIAKKKLESVEDSDLESQIKYKKRCVYVEKSEVEMAIKFLESMGFPVVQARGEADPQCAGINIADKAYGVVSQDWDTLIFGAKKMITDSNKKGKIFEYDRDEILKALKIDQDQFVELAMALGCDYCDGITVNGIDKSKEIDVIYERYLKYGSLENMIKGLKEENENQKHKRSGMRFIIPQNLENNWRIIKAQFIDVVILNPEGNMNFNWRPPNYTTLEKFLLEIKIDNVSECIIKLRTLYNQYSSYGNRLIGSNNRNRNYKKNNKSIVSQLPELQLECSNQLVVVT